MRNLCVVLVLAMYVSASAWADGFDGQNNGGDAFRQCVAQSARSTGSMLAFQMMQNACSKLYRESSAMNDREKDYYVCLLRSLRGVNNDINAQVAAKSCPR